MKNNLGFWGILKLWKVAITNLQLTKFWFVRKFRPKRFHKIDSRLNVYGFWPQVATEAKSAWNTINYGPC
jgi:hypothetical protein